MTDYKCIVVLQKTLGQPSPIPTFRPQYGLAKVYSILVGPLEHVRCRIARTINGIELTIPVDRIDQLIWLECRVASTAWVDVQRVHRKVRVCLSDCASHGIPNARPDGNSRCSIARVSFKMLRSVSSTVANISGEDESHFRIRDWETCLSHQGYDVSSYIFKDNSLQGFCHFFLHKRIVVLWKNEKRSENRGFDSRYGLM